MKKYSKDQGTTRWYLFEGSIKDNKYAWTHPVDVYRNRFYACELEFINLYGSPRCQIAFTDGEFFYCTDDYFEYNKEMWIKLEKLLAGGMSHMQILEFLEL